LEIRKSGPLLAISAGAVLLALLVFSGLRFALASQVSSVVDEMTVAASRSGSKE
jgi:type VI protein secretion system component VasF